ncbi:hypothetical protein ED312_10250 [Sinomicrobium pectinilyticum]|uniref:Uncharacterized protein n=1 Tax=Sinomicrobium pectinilyticum TaxID=1084421 RepID=A0A3N0EH28_SINP1|nr:hypothetical protein [Sinomicrobium pectinilyticum]RNL87185.1 hypothetical protein ED312_10250 [Sinomicrobium pectinilyticum]
MEQNTLKKLRLLIPGIIGVIIGTYYYWIITGQSIEEIEFKEYSIPILIAIAFGTLFYLTDIRFLITNFSHKKIDLNIKNHVIKLYTKSLTDEQKQFLYKNNRLKSVFYNIIDNDESLKKKQTNVYFNGLIWTSTADLVLISFLFALVFLVSIMIFKEVADPLLMGGFILILISLISLVGHVLAFLKHIKLSNEQIEYIETHHIKRVDEIIDGMINNI